MNQRSHVDTSFYDVATQTLAVKAGRPLGTVIQVTGVRSNTSSFRLAGGSCVVGTASSADIVLEDRAVSRAHVELAIVAGGIAVCDLGSRNGTFYQGKRIDRVVLTHGSTITVGSANVFLGVDKASLATATHSDDEFRGVLGVSPAMKRILGILAQLEASKLTVLVTGEAGAGKHLVARALHEGSGVHGPFISVDCGAIGAEHIAHELFGERNGPNGARRGAFESAVGGTLFLDDVGELPLDVQAMVFRTLENADGRISGGESPSRVDARVIAATDRALEEEVLQGRFREDLYQRLALVKVHLPPLRGRIEDIGPLAERFAAAAGVEALPPEVLRQLETRPWPGNVRELRGVVQAYATLRGFSEIPSSTGYDRLDRELAMHMDMSRPYADLKDELVERFERIYLANLLTKYGVTPPAAPESREGSLRPPNSTRPPYSRP